MADAQAQMMAYYQQVLQAQMQQAMGQQGAAPAAAGMPTAPGGMSPAAQMAVEAAAIAETAPQQWQAAPAQTSGNDRTGYCRLWNAEKKFGFIVQDDGGDDVFVHRSDLAGGIEVLQKNEKVSFGTYPDPNKPGKVRASNVTSMGVPEGSNWSNWSSGESAGSNWGDAGKAKTPVVTDSKKIFVGGLSKTTEEAAITEFFSIFGTVEEVILKRDWETGASKGFAFVSFAEDGAVQQVLSTYDVNEIDGKWVDVKVAEAKGSGKGGEKGKAGGKEGKDGKGFLPGDWNCPSCGYHNFARNLECQKCGTANPSPSPFFAGKGAAAQAAPQQGDSSGFVNFGPSPTGGKGAAFSSPY